MKDVTSLGRIWIWFLLIGFALLLLSTNSDQSPSWNPVEKFAIEITAPFQKIVKGTINATKEFWLNYFNLVNVHRDNEALRQEIMTLKMDNSRYRELLETHERLRALLQFKQSIHQEVLAAQVIGLDPSGWFESIIIDKGETAGILLNMPVVNANGVVGKIVSVSPHYSKVLLIIDQNSAVDCLIQRSRDRGMIKGFTGGSCKLQYVIKSGDVAIDDLVVTSGLGGIFPKGLPVGYVMDIREIAGALFKDIDIKTAVDFSRLEEVLVIMEEPKSSIHPKETE